MNKFLNSMITCRKYTESNITPNKLEDAGHDKIIQNIRDCDKIGPFFYFCFKKIHIIFIQAVSKCNIVNNIPKW